MCTGDHRQHDEPRGTDLVRVREAAFNLTHPPTRQVLFASEKLTGNHTLRDIAISHADKTMANHVRPDG